MRIAIVSLLFLVACDKPVTLDGAKASAEAHSYGGHITYEMADERIKSWVTNEEATGLHRDEKPGGMK